MAEKASQVPKGTRGPTYARQRRETQFDILTDAIALKRKVARYVMNERRVPKRWRYVEGLPALEYAREIRDAIMDANGIRVDGGPKPEDLERRRLLQERAVAACNRLLAQLDDIAEECEGATPESMREIAGLALSLIRRIPRWGRSDAERSGGG